MKPVLIIQNWAAESPGTIGEYLDSKEIPYRVVHLYDGEALPDNDDVDRIIVLGGPLSLSVYREHDWLKELFTYTAQAVRDNRPLLADCFGAQMLAHVLGARVEPNGVKEIGFYNTRLTEEGQNDSIFEGFSSEFDVFQWHGDTYRIPFGAKHLAKSSDCINQAFRKGNAVGVQFHLEPQINEIPNWCDEFTKELTEFGLTKDEIVSSFRENAEALRSLNFRLIENFLRM